MGGKMEMLEWIARFLDTKNAFEAQSIQIRDELLMRLFEILDEPTLNDIALFQNFIQFLIWRIVSSRKSQKWNKTRHAPQTEIQNPPMLNDISTFGMFVSYALIQWKKTIKDSRISDMARWWNNSANTPDIIVWNPTLALCLSVKKSQENPCQEISDIFGSFENSIFYSDKMPTKNWLLTTELVTFCQLCDIQDYNTLLESLSQEENFKIFLSRKISLRMLAILYCFFDEKPSNFWIQIKRYILEKKESLYSSNVWDKTISTYERYKGMDKNKWDIRWIEDMRVQVISLDTAIDDLVWRKELPLRVINVLKGNDIKTVWGIIDVINTNMNRIIHSQNFGNTSFVNLYLFLRSIGEPAKSACEKMEAHIEGSNDKFKTLFHKTLQKKKLGYVRKV